MSGSEMPDVLSSWKEIACYLRLGVRTVQRYHSDLQLPVHKLASTPRAHVFAFTSELNRWMKERAASTEHAQYATPAPAQGRLSLSDERTRLRTKSEFTSQRLKVQLMNLRELLPRLGELRSKEADRLGDLRITQLDVLESELEAGLILDRIVAAVARIDTSRWKRHEPRQALQSLNQRARASRDRRSMLIHAMVVAGIGFSEVALTISDANRISLNTDRALHAYEAALRALTLPVPSKSESVELKPLLAKLYANLIRLHAQPSAPRMEDTSPHEMQGPLRKAQSV